MDSVEDEIIFLFRQLPDAERDELLQFAAGLLSKDKQTPNYKLIQPDPE